VGTRERLAEAAHAARVLARSGALRPEAPNRLVQMARAAGHWGIGLAAAFATSAARYRDRVAIVDERGTTTYRELDARTDALARALAARGAGADTVVGVLCRNHRGFFDATGAIAKLGADAVYLNTGFSAPQLRDVAAREQVGLLIHDEEFGDLAAAAGVDRRVVAWTDRSDSAAGTDTIDALVARHATGTRPPRPRREGRTIILTSGTTGTPKGAARDHSASAGPAVALLERIPYRTRETMIVAAPCFHSWGFANALVGLLLGNTLVLDRHFDPERTLGAIARHRAQVLVAVPVMLVRILELPEAARTRHDTSSLRLVPLSGSALPGDLATRFMDAFGDVIYNLYGSTEIGYVAIAAPADLRAAPSTAGRPPRGTEVRLLDEHDRDVPRGATGSIFVRSGLLFGGYTDGNSKRVVDGFMQTGDTGHFDAAGRLFVDGRDDDMIVSGGENVFPAEVEDVIVQHPDVVEAAVVGIPDPEFGQRLKAYVVPRAGATPDPEAIRDHVRANLARYKVPRDVELVGELPRNATGKVLRRDLET
jgi:fatty-acyl-CoA synthase